jgi:hypothetical protein
MGLERSAACCPIGACAGSGIALGFEESDGFHLYEAAPGLAAGFLSEGHKVVPEGGPRRDTCIHLESIHHHFQPGRGRVPRDERRNCQDDE